MIYLLEILRGFCLSIGFVIGMFVTVIVIVKILFGNKKKKEKYKPEDLIKPFNEYKGKLLEAENYEEVKEAEQIISELNKNKVPREVELFEIIKKTSIEFGGLIKDDEWKTDSKSDDGIKFVKRYIVKGKKPDISKDSDDE
jgi:uncharacterized protein YktB (UPF0637 family)